LVVLPIVFAPDVDATTVGDAGALFAVVLELVAVLDVPPLAVG
jgi:hypothetical protein